MRRVHWSATARRGELMVRQEETAATPRATLVLDQRESCYDHGFLSPFWAETPDDSSPASSETFEWAVSAVMSVGTHLLERGFAVRFIDAAARPGLARSPSASAPGVDILSGAAGVEDLGEGLAALGLEPASSAAAGNPPPEEKRKPLRPGRPSQPWPAQPPAADRGPFGDALEDTLLEKRHRGPLVVITGSISEDEARRLAPAADHVPAAIAVLVTERPPASAAALALLRSAGWQAVAVSPAQSLASAWTAAPEPAGHSRTSGHRP